MQTGRPNSSEFAPGHRAKTKNYQTFPGPHSAPSTAAGTLFAKTAVLCPDNTSAWTTSPSGIDHPPASLVGATLSMYPPAERDNLGNFIARGMREPVKSSGSSRAFSGVFGALATAGDIVFYGTLEGYLKAVDIQTGKSSNRSRRLPELSARQHLHPCGSKHSVLSGFGGWAGIGMAAADQGHGRFGAVELQCLGQLHPARRVLSVFGLPEYRRLTPQEVRGRHPATRCRPFWRNRYGCMKQQRRAEKRTRIPPRRDAACGGRCCFPPYTPGHRRRSSASGCPFCWVEARPP